MNGKTLRRVLGYLRPYRATLAAACAGALASVLFTLLGPVFTGRAIDCIIGPGAVDFSGAARYLCLVAVSALLAAAGQWLMNVGTRTLSSSSTAIRTAISSAAW